MEAQKIIEIFDKKECIIENYKFLLLHKQHNTASRIFLVEDLSGVEITKILKIEKSPSPKAILEYDFLSEINTPLGVKVLEKGKYLDFEYYFMEYLKDYNTYSDLFLTQKLDYNHIDLFLQKIQTLPKNSPSETVFENLYSKKLLERRDILLNSKLKEQSEEIFNWLQSQSIDFKLFKYGQYFGDSHFENILFKDGDLKIIDPKGENQLTLEYDLGKFLQSLNGGYEYVKAKKTPKINTDLVNYFDVSVIKIWGQTTLQNTYLTEIYHFYTLTAHHLSDLKESELFLTRAKGLILEYVQKFELNWKLANSKNVFEGRVKLVEQEFITAMGYTTTYLVQEGRDAVSVMVENEDKILVTRQYRPALQKWIYDLPGGGLIGTDLEANAVRECVEETGILPKNLQFLTKFAPNPGRINWCAHIFYANSFETKTKLEPNSDLEEITKHVWLPKSSLLEMITAGEIVDPSLIIAYFMSLNQKL